MFFIFWSGQKTHKKKIGSGTFYCPACKTEQPYTRYKIGTQFTLYSLIPVGRIKEIGDVVECHACHKQFPPLILSSQPSPGEQGTVWVCLNCSNVNPMDKGSCVKCRQPR